MVSFGIGVHKLYSNVIQGHDKSCQNIGLSYWEPSHEQLYQIDYHALPLYDSNMYAGINQNGSGGGGGGGNHTFQRKILFAAVKFYDLV